MNCISPIVSHKNIVPYFRESSYFEDINESNLMSSNFISGHFGNIPIQIDNSVKVVTTLRNPIKRIISHYVKAYDKSIKNPVKDFENWILSDLDYKAKNNMQSRFLINGFSDKYIGKTIRLSETDLINNFRSDSWGIGDVDPTIESANNAIKEMLLVGKTESLTLFINNLSEIMFDFYKIDPFMINMNQKKNSNSMSDYIYTDIDTEIVKIIEENNKIDFNLWESIKH